ncbi:7-deoxyloganetin glucosyltransferase isoform X2 [Brachypodium distachyon]|uniref:Glycosyltransferase n=1 Tax=Brachypodium distachyon TaxID=15368 RepID=I1I187_BRADI|nr:7-deoxyloganetin glucosyltransferase isoform X2 [Brachypodium distachyon]KQJ95229.1 hypothetical protein BRADI_3g15945v3 [Brachypodium distachyon]|eukprot:XP_010236434.1 7-deoxyloganetin glucosyltransferase isoform X2 [Brachypodium distachyon]
MARPHAVVVPFPCTGHINPALQLARLLHRRGFHVTFVNTEHNHRRLAQTIENAAGMGFHFEAIPDGLTDAKRAADGYGAALSASMGRHCAAPLRDLVVRLSSNGGAPPVTCLLPTALMSFALGVARELGIPSMVLWGASAAALMADMSLRDLKERGYLPLKDESCLTNGHLDTTIIDWIPGMPPISLGDISSFVRTTDPDDFGLRFNDVEANGCTKAGALVLNTFDGLEPHVLAALRAEFPRIFTIGPLGSLLDTEEEDATNGGCGGLSLWKQDTECLAWLDAQEPGSVVYANFGSLTVLTASQLEEFAWGLADSGHKFLLSIRDNLVIPSGSGDGGGLPAGFMAAAAERCSVTAWCPQERVLRHGAVGCFVTHSGWNSTCESVAAGVPMVCWPGFADQYTNCKYVCEVWGVGLRLDEEVKREQVAGHVKKAMEPAGEVRRSAAAWKAKAAEAVRPGGSSFENLQSMVKALNSEAPLKR